MQKTATAIKIGDTVLLRQPKKNKLTTPLNAEPFRVNNHCPKTANFPVTEENSEDEEYESETPLANTQDVPLPNLVEHSFMTY